MIRLTNITLRFGERLLFENLSFFASDSARIALVGANGEGKTTLFRVILKEQIPDAGSVELSRCQNIGHLPQDVAELGNGTVLDFLKERAGVAALEEDLRSLEHRIAATATADGEYRRLLSMHENVAALFLLKDGYSFEAKAKKVLRGLGFRPNAAETPCAVFSGGWKMRIALAAILLARPPVLLLDEPTNHLDTESMEWLEGYLKDYDGCLITISHDRRFLDKMTTQTAELSRGTITLYRGNYTWYLAEREKRREQLIKEMELQRSEIKKTQEFIERFRYKASKASQVQSRIKSLERFQEVRLESDHKTVKFHFPPCPRSGRTVLTAQDLGMAYGGKEVFRSLNLVLERGDRVALVGVNGAGKSTLCRLLSGEEPPQEGDVHLGFDVKRAFFSQESPRNLNYQNTVWQEVQGLGTRHDDLAKRNLLGAFLFSGDDIHKPVAVLSGGEKARLGLLKLLLEDTNFLILDEPTNHLDMATKDMFQQALLSYGGTLLLVSHDRAFLDDLVHRVVEIRDGKLFEYRGNYSFFLEKRAENLLAEGAEGSEDPPSFPIASPEKDFSGRKSREQKREDAAYRARLSVLRRAVIQALDPVEKRIAALEGEKKSLERSLCDPATLGNSGAVQEALQRLGTIEKELNNLMPRWEELMAEMEAVTQESP